MAHVFPLTTADKVDVVDGGPWDVLFLVSEVASAAAAGHFNFDYCAPRGKKSLAWLCAKAILYRFSAFRWISERTDFLVVRYGGETVAAALIWFTNVESAQTSKAAILGYLVVGQHCSGRGFGAHLISAIQRRIPPGMTLQCWCTPRSHRMQRLLARLGFVRAHKSKSIQVNYTRLLVTPSLWVWGEARRA